MTTPTTHVRSAPKNGPPAPSRPTRPRWQTMTWFLLATAATVFCAATVIGAFTWIDDVNWITFGFAALGVIGFGASAFRLWRELEATPKKVTPLGLWLAAAFWAVFGGMTGYAVYDQAVVVEDGASWPLLVLLAVFVVLMLWSAFDYARRAWRLSRQPD